MTVAERECLFIRCLKTDVQCWGVLFLLSFVKSEPAVTVRHCFVPSNGALERFTKETIAVYKGFDHDTCPVTRAPSHI